MNELPAPSSASHLALIGREQQVLLLIADGMRNKEVAAVLGITHSSVATRLNSQIA